MDITNLNRFEDAKKVLIHNFIKKKTSFNLQQSNKASFLSSRKSLLGFSRKYFSNEKSRDYINYNDENERDKKSEENFSKYIKIAVNIHLKLGRH